MNFFRLRVRRKIDFHDLFSNGDEFTDGAFHHHRIREVHEMDGDGGSLAPDGDVENAGASNGDGRFFVGRPIDGVAEEFEMIDAKDFPKSAVDVPREINKAGVTKIARKDLRDAGVAFARIDLLHRQVRIAGNQGYGKAREGAARIDFNARNAVNDSWRIFKPAQEWIGVFADRK